MGLMKKTAGSVQHTPMTSSADSASGSIPKAPHQRISQAEQARRIMQFLTTSDARLSNWHGNALELTRQMKVLQRVAGHRRATAAMNGFLQRQRDMTKADALQRQAIEEDELQMRAAPEALQRQALEDDELLQGRMEPLQRQELDEDELLQPKAVDGPTERAPNKTGMPDQLKAGVEALSGMDMSDVRVHYNSDKPAEVGALAYAQGTDIHLGPGQEQHLPHEAWHVVQQAEGRVRPTMQLFGVAINDDAALEREADARGSQVPKSFGLVKALSSDPTAPIQRYPTQSDSGRRDAIIYAITTKDQNEIIYVGQTTDARAGDRFIEHVNNDHKAPWWTGNGNDYSDDDESKWPYRVHLLEELKNVTKFETTVAEQWWLEKYKKEDMVLLNQSTPCSIENFNKRSKDASLYDPSSIGVEASWKPSMKAK